MGIDELNILKTEKKKKERSIDYEKFFGDMYLTDLQKKERIEKAKEFERKLLFLFSLIAIQAEFEVEIQWNNIQEKVENAYLEMLGDNEIDDYTRDYISYISKEITRTTKENLEDEYYLSYDRARLIAENEVNTIWNYSEFKMAIEAGKTKKTWHTMLDLSVRLDHAMTEGKTIPINDLFVVGDSLFRFPRDEMFNPDPKEVIGCRCICTYS